MLSPGKWHLQVPKKLAENIEFRRKLLLRARNDRAFQIGQMEMCANDILYWLNAYVWQFNPKLREVGPFITWPYQDVAICGGETEIGGEKRFQHGILACVEDQKDCRWPKSREGGATLCALAAVTWLCNFKRHVKAMAISRTEAAVKDVDDPDSLFDKVKKIIEYLPDWMTGGIKQKKGAVSFKRTNSTFTGSANVADAGVGGRDTILLVDEFGQFDKNGEAIYDFTTDTADCRLFIFTHKDNAGMAYQLCYDPKFSAMREIITHWSQHPLKKQGLYKWNDLKHDIDILDKNYYGGRYKFPKDFEFVREARPTGGPFPGIRSPWYDEQCVRRNERDIQMNLDIDPRGASDRFFNPYRIKILQNTYCRPPVWTGTLEYDHRTGIPKKLLADPDGLIHLWINPKSETTLPLVRAGAAIDIASGTGHSPSCLCVYNARTGEKILQYSNATIFAPDFSVFVVAMLRMFKDERGAHPMVAYESQGGGVFKKRGIDELKYSPVYVERREDVFGRPKNESNKPGWNVSPKSVLALMQDYADGLYQGKCINFSLEAMEETLQIYHKGNTCEYSSKGAKTDDASGAGVHHGDLVRTDGLAYLVIKDMGLENPLAKVAVEEYPDPRTFDGRVRLHEMAEREEEGELVWQ